MVALSSSSSAGPRAGVPYAPPTVSARVAYAGILLADEMTLVDELMFRLYGSGLEPIGFGPADVLVVGRLPVLDAGDLARARPRRVVLVVRRREPRHDVEARGYAAALPDAHVLVLETEALARMGVDDAARLARVSLAACWAVDPSVAAGPLPLLPGAPACDA